MVEPHPYVNHVEWDGVDGAIGSAGMVCMNLIVFAYPLSVSFSGIHMLEIADESGTGPHSGYFDDPVLGPPWSHSSGAGAGMWSVVLENNSWTGDRAGMSRAIQSPWTDGWKEWPIPIGWGTYDASLGKYVIKGECHPVPTSQRFEIDASGNVTIRKFSRWIKRAPDNKVWLDGTRVR